MLIEPVPNEACKNWLVRIGRYDYLVCRHMDGNWTVHVRVAPRWPRKQSYWRWIKSPGLIRSVQEYDLARGED